MSTSSMSAPLGLLGEVLSPGQRILLATNGSDGAIAGARVAAALAARYHLSVRVVSVVDTRSAPIPPPLDLALALDDDEAASPVHEAQVAEARAALSGAVGVPVDWPIRIALGTPASAIVKEATRVGTALIVLGLRRHGVLDRAVHDETVLNVMRHAACPVLGVVAGTTALPSRVMAAVDFSDASRDAARVASAIVGDQAVLVLAYVAPVATFRPGDGEAVIHDLGVESALRQMSAHLGANGIAVDHVVLHHESPRPTAAVLLDYAEGANIDLVAAGSARHSRLDRWMMGSVSTDLVRDGRRSVLIVPPTYMPQP